MCPTYVHNMSKMLTYICVFTYICPKSCVRALFTSKILTYTCIYCVQRVTAYLCVPGKWHRNASCTGWSGRRQSDAQSVCIWYLSILIPSVFSIYTTDTASVILLVIRPLDSSLSSAVL